MYHGKNALHGANGHGKGATRATVRHSSPWWLQMSQRTGNRQLARKLQAKLNISAPNDPLEVEADRVAGEVMGMPQSDGPRAAATPSLQRKPEEAVAGIAVPEDFPASFGAGQPMDKTTRSFMESRFGQDFSGVRVHTDSRAAASARAVNALAFTVGRDLVFGAGQYAPGTHEGRKLIAHELTHVVQQGQSGEPSVQRFHIPHGPGPGHTADERPRIAPTFTDLMDTIKTIVKESTFAGGALGGDTVNMDLFVQKAGGAPVSKQLDDALGTKSTQRIASRLNYRYLFTCRCGFIDMRHFLQLMYISNWVGSAFPGADGNRVATRKGREHELEAESESRFGPEDTPTNALGAFTGSRLAAIPTPDGLINEIEKTLRRCGPVDFKSLGATSQDTIIHHYADLIPDPAPRNPGDLIPSHQNQTAIPDILSIPECGGKERSFPFELDTSDPDKKTIAGPAFDAGAAGLKSDSDIREFLTTQRMELLKDLRAAEKLRLVKRLLEGWVSDADIDGVEIIYRNASDAEKAQIRAAVNVDDLSSLGQRFRLKALFL